MKTSQVDLSFCLTHTSFVGFVMPWLKICINDNGPHCNKTCFRGFQQCETLTSLLSYRDLLEIKKIICSKLSYDTFQTANNKSADQSAQLFAKPGRQVFSRRGPAIKIARDKPRMTRLV